MERVVGFSGHSRTRSTLLMVNKSIRLLIQLMLPLLLLRAYCLNQMVTSTLGQAIIIKAEHENGTYSPRWPPEHGQAFLHSNRRPPFGHDDDGGSSRKLVEQLEQTSSIFKNKSSGSSCCRAASTALDCPRFIKCHRMSPFQSRFTSRGVMRAQGPPHPFESTSSFQQKHQQQQPRPRRSFPVIQLSLTSIIPPSFPSSSSSSRSESSPSPTLTSTKSSPAELNLQQFHTTTPAPHQQPPPRLGFSDFLSPVDESDTGSEDEEEGDDEANNGTTSTDTDDEGDNSSILANSGGTGDDEDDLDSDSDDGDEQTTSNKSTNNRERTLILIRSGQMPQVGRQSSFSMQQVPKFEGCYCDTRYQVSSFLQWICNKLDQLARLFPCRSSLISLRWPTCFHSIERRNSCLLLLHWPVHHGHSRQLDSIRPKNVSILGQMLKIHQIKNKSQGSLKIHTKAPKSNYCTTTYSKLPAKLASEQNKCLFATWNARSLTQES